VFSLLEIIVSRYLIMIQKKFWLAALAVFIPVFLSSCSNKNTVTSVNPSPPTPVEVVDRFACEKDEGGVHHTRVINNNGEKPDFIKYESRYFEQGGYPSPRRCREITARLNAFVSSASQKGSIMQIGVAIDRHKTNGHDTICLVHSVGDSCNGILLTIKRGTSPAEVLTSLRDAMSNSQSGYVHVESGGGTRGFLPLYPLLKK
jgi:hypothetical protein